MKKFFMFLIFLSFSLSFIEAEQKWRFKYISPENLKHLMDSNQEYVLIDALTPIHFAVEHLPNAVNIPVNRVKDKDGNLNPHMPNNENVQIIFYCMNPRCVFSKINAENAIDSGYKNVYVMTDGIAGWKKKGYPIIKGDLTLPTVAPLYITPPDLGRIINEVVLIDLRDIGLGKKKIKGAKNISLIEFIDRYHEIPKDKEIVLYTLKGIEDKLAVKFLVGKGYSLSNIKYLRGGITAWINYKGEVE